MVVVWHVPYKRKACPKSRQVIPDVFRTWVTWLIETSNIAKSDRAQLGRVRRFLIDVLRSGDLFVSFTPERTRAWAQVALEGDSLLVNLNFPEGDDLKSRFVVRGILIPPEWEETFTSPGKALTFRVDEAAFETVAPFLEEVFIKIYGCPRDGVIHAVCS